MVSAFVGGPAAQYPAPLSAGLMAGFGPPSGGPYLGGSDPTQRLQYYDSQQPSGHAVAGKDVSGRRSGKVKFFDTQKGYGFINDYRPEDIGHEEAITAKAGFKSLAEGEEAEYDLVRGPKGFQAANVTGPGGSQVVGDTRSRVNKNAFLAMSPYAAMFPYMHQDPTSFFASSAYSQPVMLIPPQTEYRNPAPLSASAYRTVPPAPTYAATPSSYASPAAIRPYDISKDWPGSSLSSLSVNDGGRSSKPAGSSSAAPFGGMFGAIPGFETLPNTSISAQQGSAPVHQSLSSSALGAGFGSAGQMAAGQPYKAFGTTVASGYARSGSVDGGDNLPSTSPRDSTISRPTDTGPAPRPAAQHSRSSSLLYASKKSGSPAA